MSGAGQAGRITGVLGDLLPIKYGKSLPAAARDSSGSVPVFGSSGVVGTHAQALTNGPTIVVGRKGNVGAIHYSPVPCWPIDTAYFVEAPVGHSASYYRYLLTSLNLSQLDKSTAIPGLSRDDYNAVQVSIHPPEQQEKVVAEIDKQFSRLDEAVANLQRVKANLKRYKAAVLKAAVEGRLVETVGGWRASTLGAEGAIIGGLTKNQKRNDLSLKLPYLRVANVYANELRLDDIEYIGVAEKELEKLLVRKGDLLVVEGNGSPDQIGRVALWNDAIPNCVHQNHLIKVRFGEEVMPEWALIWMLSPIGRHEIEKVSASTSGLHTLSVGKVSRLPIDVPELEEQSRIVAEVDRQLSILRGVEAEVNANLQRAQALRQSVLAKSFQ